MALILAVDDRAMLLEAIGDALKEEHSCILALSGAEAVAAYVRNRPAVVLLDLMISGMSGRETASRILEFDPSARIIALSAVEDVTQVVALFRLGFCDFLEKPCDPRNLLGTVNSNLPVAADGDLVLTPTSESMTALVIETFAAGDVPVLIGPKGVGKKTAFRAARRSLGADPLPAVPLQAPGSGESSQLTRVLPGRRGPAGLLLWGQEGRLKSSSPEDWVKAIEAARTAYPAAGAFHLGVVWDSTSRTPEVAAPQSGFAKVRFPGLGERPEELLSILDQFAGDEGVARGDWDVEWLARYFCSYPRLASMRLMRLLARNSGIWRHLRASAL